MNNKWSGSRPNSWIVVGCYLLMHLAGTQLQAEEPQLIRLRGEPLASKLQSIDDDRLTFHGDSGKAIELQSQQFVRWGSLANPYRVEQVLLLDGSILIGHLTKIRRDAFVLETELWGELTLDRDSVQALVWALPPEPIAQWKFRERLTDTTKSRETLTLRNGDPLSGQLIEGNLRDLRVLPAAATSLLSVKRELVASWHRGNVNVKRSRNHSTKELVLGLSEGTQLVATEVQVGEHMQAKLRCGMTLVSVPGVRPIDEGLVCYVRSNSQHVQYLSDLTPLGYKHVPFLSVDWEWHADRNVLGGPLSSSSRDYYAKGVGMHSTSRLAFDLDAHYDEFQAEVCLDATSGDKGSVVFRVFVFGEQRKWMETFKSPVVRGGEEPVSVRVALGNATRIALVVDYADQGDVLDRANWLGARVVVASSRHNGGSNN